MSFDIVLSITDVPCVPRGLHLIVINAVWRIFARKTEFHKKEKEEAENEKFEIKR